MNKCGDCQACCEVPSIKALNKPVLVKCDHQCETGCSIYSKRPAPCVNFECLYRIDNLDEKYRPDICGVMIAHIGGSFKAFRIRDYVDPDVMNLIKIMKNKYGIDIKGGDYRNPQEPLRRKNGKEKTMAI